MHIFALSAKTQAEKKKKESGITVLYMNVTQEFIHATLSRPEILLLNQNVNVLIKTDVISKI